MIGQYYNPDYCIQLKPVNRTEEEARQLAEKLNCEYHLTKDELKCHCINGKYYYFKFFNRFYAVLNELIGPKIAHRLELRTTNNLPAILHYGENLTLYGIVSEDFKDPNKQYKNMFELGFKNGTFPAYRNLKTLKKFCRKEDYEELLNDIFKMTCLDYLMGQADRVSSNFLFEIDGNKVRLAPLFDYAEAYESIKAGCYFNIKENKRIYCSVGNALFAPAFWENKFQSLLRKYPAFREYLEKIQEIDILEILEEIEGEYKLKINDDYKYYYDTRTKEKQRSLVL